MKIKIVNFDIDIVNKISHLKRGEHSGAYLWMEMVLKGIKKPLFPNACKAPKKIAICELGDKIIGWSGIGQSHQETKGTVSTFIQKEYRGKKLAKKLLSKIASIRKGETIRFDNISSPSLGETLKKLGLNPIEFYSEEEKKMYIKFYNPA